MIIANIKDAKRYIEVNKLENKVIKEKIENYVPYNDQEEVDKTTLLNFLDTFKDVLTRNNIFGHFTASAFVVNKERNKQNDSNND